MFSKLATFVACTSLVDAHVRGIYVASSIRSVGNAPQPAADGAYSVSGPCAGQNTFGRNGVNEVRAGDPVTVSMAYNGGHNAPANHFSLAFACGKPGDQSVFVASSGKNTANPVRPTTLGAQYIANNRAPGDQGTTPVQLTFTMPPAAAGADGDMCTISMLDQRDWGACVDFKVLAAAGPPAPTEEPVTIDDKDFATTFKIDTAACSTEVSGCICPDGTLRVSHVKGASSATGFLSLNKNGAMTGVEDNRFLLEQVPNVATIKGRVDTRDGGDGDPLEFFDISVYWNKKGLSVSGANTGDVPKYCGFDVSQVKFVSSSTQSIASAMVVFALALFAA